MVVITMDHTFLDLVRLGIKAESSFSYEGKNVTYRALSSYEVDKCRYNSMELCDDKLARFILRLRLGQLNGKLNLDNVPAELYKNYVRYLLEFDYWILFYATKDFQPSDYSIDDVRKMQDVHTLAQKIIDFSCPKSDMVMEFVRTEDGQELAKIVYEFRQPLVSDAWKLTPLQHDFLYMAGPNGPKTKYDSFEDLDKVMFGVMSDVRK